MMSLSQKFVIGKFAQNVSRNLHFILQQYKHHRDKASMVCKMSKKRQRGYLITSCMVCVRNFNSTPRWVAWKLLAHRQCACLYSKTTRMLLYLHRDFGEHIRNEVPYNVSIVRNLGLSNLTFVAEEKYHDWTPNGCKMKKLSYSCKRKVNHHSIPLLCWAQEKNPLLVFP